jgi:lactoylglutathione lyase
MNKANTNSLANKVSGARILHTMFRVRDLERSLDFYTKKLGMQLMRHEEYPEGQFTLAFVGYGNEANNTVLELTHNWGTNQYDIGTAYGHIALSVSDLVATCAALQFAGVKLLRQPGLMKHSPADGSAPEMIAFIEDPDGYRIELIEVRNL